jgi:protein O-mannosyl-transferase
MLICSCFPLMKASISGETNPKSFIPRNFGYIGLIFCATILAYLPALNGGFIWNDSDYVTAPALRSLGGLARIWTEVGATQQYYPLLHSAFWVQHLLWGDHPIGYHVVNLLLHAASAVLFALVLRRLFSGFLPWAYDGAEWLAALLFALHPVNVESVAWISEQKNTTSLAFYLAAALCYLHFDEARRPRTYAAALALFAVSLSFKTVTATLPAAMLVIIWWQRGRIGWRRDVVPLVPWFALGAAAGLFSSWVERRFVGAQGAGFEISAAGRILVAGRAIWSYVGTLVWPFGLNFIYPRWKVDTAVWWQWLFPIGVIATVAALWALRRRTRGPLAAFLFFAGSLFPALGFVNLYGARYSWVWDHWQYLPDLGLIALAAAGLTAGWRRAAPSFPGLGAGLAAALAVLLGSLTWAHCGMFRDDETLYRMTIERNPGSWFAHNNLGNLLSHMPGRTNDAIAQYNETLRIDPDFAEAHSNLGIVLASLPGRLDDAVAQYEEALRIKPDLAEAHANLGIALARLPGRLDEAIAQYEEALQIVPEDAEAHLNLANALVKVPGRLDDAIAHYEAALRLKPDLAEAHTNLGNVLVSIPGRSDEAITQYGEALRANPDSVEAHNNLGITLAQMPGRLNDAVAQFEAALRINPEFAQAHNNLGNAFSEMPGRSNDAITQYKEALRIDPNFLNAHTNLGNVLVGIPGRSDEAITQYEEALRLNPDAAAVHFDLAVALLQAPGRSNEAEAQLESALALQPNLDVAKQLLQQVRSSRQ